MNLGFYTAWPMLAACFALYYLRDLDTRGTIDKWSAISGSWWPASTFAALLPVFSLYFVLLMMKKDVWKAAASGAVMAFLLAIKFSTFRAARVSKRSMVG